MFRAKTVFIVGAGASAEFAFPLGGALLKDISKRIDISYQAGQLQRGDHVIVQALRDALGARTDVASYNEHLHSAWQLVASSKQGLSIDSVLDALEDEKASKVGKFGIVRCILAAEEASPLSKWVDHFPDQINLGTFANTWLDQLTKLLTEGRRKSRVGEIFENLSIINFNYDRIIEHYLPFAISNYYGLKPEEVREVMPSLAVFRPYGKAGNLPWETAENAVAFGNCSAANIQVAAKQILTFTEQVQDEALVTGIRGVIQNADRIVFLGFGYHRQNLELLRINAPKHVEIFGTSFGMSNSDTHMVTQELRKLFGLDDYAVFREHEYARLHALECNSFISEIWRTLTGEPGDDPTMEMSTSPSFSMPAMPSFPKFTV